MGERTKKIEQEANTAKRKMTKRMAKDKVKLESLTVVADQYSAVTASINKQEPMGKEEAQLAADEKVVTKAQEEAKMVKKQASEHMKNELAKETAKDLVQGKEIQDLKKELKKEEEVVKAQKLTIKEQGTKRGDIKMKIEKAKVEADGAKMLMKEAQREEKSVVAREKQAAMSLISEMKVEIAKQLAASKRKEKSRTDLAKRIIAKATAMMLRAKSLEGRATKPDTPKEKQHQKTEQKKLMKMSFDELQKKAKALVAGGG